MAEVVVTPETFTLVAFDAGEIASIAHEVADAIALPDDVRVDIVVDEAAIVAQVAVRVTNSRVVIEATGGAFESLRTARQFAAERCRFVLGQALLRAGDRLDASFGDAPPDSELPLPLDAAWSTYIEGRLVRAGVVSGRGQRRRYHFRVRHGFHDAADAVFDELWSASGLTWAAIVAASARATAVPVPA